MKNQEKELTFKFLKEDLPAGLVVFLVALPLLARYNQCDTCH